MHGATIRITQLTLGLRHVSYSKFLVGMGKACIFCIFRTRFLVLLRLFISHSLLKF